MDLLSVLVQLAGYGYPIYYPRPYTWGVAPTDNPIKGTYDAMAMPTDHIAG